MQTHHKSRVQYDRPVATPDPHDDASSAHPKAIDGGATRTRHRAASTQTKIVVAAERLFAEHGLRAVSMREILDAAGQRNASAIHYHFGPKPDLVTAVFRYRMSQVNERRLELLARMYADGQAADVHALVEALIRPLVAVVTEPDCHYARFLAQMSADPTYRISESWEIASSLHAVRDAIGRLLGNLPDHIYAERWRMVTHLLVHTIADHEDHHTTSGEVLDAAQGWVARLVDACGAVLATPLSRTEDESAHDHPSLPETQDLPTQP